jgi:hypothetical protein
MFWSRWFRRRPNLPPLVAPLRDYWLTIRVRLTPPIPNIDGEGPELVGYVRIMGLRCEAKDYRRVLDDYVNDGVILWDHLEGWEVDVEKLDGRDIHTISPEGFFFQSGRIYFPRDSDDRAGAV